MSVRHNAWHDEWFCPTCQAWKPSGAATTRENLDSENPAVLGWPVLLACGREVSAEDDEPQGGPERRRRALHGRAARLPPFGKVSSSNRYQPTRLHRRAPPWGITGAPAILDRHAAPANVSGCLPASWREDCWIARPRRLGPSAISETEMNRPGRTVRAYGWSPAAASHTHTSAP